jgi:hypothetical protein
MHSRMRTPQCGQIERLLKAVHVGASAARRIALERLMKTRGKSGVWGGVKPGAPASCSGQSAVRAAVEPGVHGAHACSE